jgi:myo-inositol-1(or 4)-monophosphatase
VSVVITHRPSDLALSRRLREAASEAALEAGALLHEAFGDRPTGRPKAHDRHDLVTVHDQLAERRIRARLTSAYPESFVLGEENGLVGTGEIGWFVDPIDGTNNFAAGVPFFCVSIAAARGDLLLAGVVYDPIRSELFAADLSGASCNGVALVSTGAHDASRALLATDFPSHRGGPPELERFGELVRSFGAVRRLGSGALTLAYVAAGRIDVTFGTAANPWDVAAGALLVQAAGGGYHAVPATERPWEAPGYIAHVGGFDLDRSSLATLRVPAR